MTRITRKQTPEWHILVAITAAFPLLRVRFLGWKRRQEFEQWRAAQGPRLKQIDQLKAYYHAFNYGIHARRTIRTPYIKI